MKKTIALLLLFLTPFSLFAFDHSYKSYGEFLAQNVVIVKTHSLVRYLNIKDDPNKFELILESFANVEKDDFDTWTKTQQQAFLINAYNALVIKLIYPHIYEIDSIEDIGGMFYYPFRDDFFVLLGEERDLNSIRRDLSYEKTQDARFFFTLCNSAITSPDLYEQPFTAEKLENQLEARTFKFMQDPSKNSARFAKIKYVSLSSLLKDIEPDIKQQYGSLRNFIVKYMAQDLKEKQYHIAQKTTFIVYKDFSMRLNKKAE
ncbi:MAG: DUF547 domain-containing protein [SAR324 cluster bacterium]|nr:DUF547 domain-containing protein [SAR324 cluster bacterium]